MISLVASPSGAPGSVPNNVGVASPPQSTVGTRTGTFGAQASGNQEDGPKNMPDSGLRLLVQTTEGDTGGNV